MLAGFVMLSASVSIFCAGQSRWPIDKDAHQVGMYKASAIPACRSGIPILTLDSLGPLHPGQTREALARACPRGIYAWEWGNEGIPTPAILLRFGDAVVEVEFPDTAASSRVYRITTESPAIRTAEGFGVASRLDDITKTWGAPTFGEGECVLYVWYNTRRGLSFRVRVPDAWECEDVLAVQEHGASRLPPVTTIRQVLLFQPSP